MLPGAILANPLDTGAMPWKIHISSFIDANHLPRRTLPPDEPEFACLARPGCEQAGLTAFGESIRPDPFEFPPFEFPPSCTPKLRATWATRCPLFWPYVPSLGPPACARK